LNGPTRPGAITVTQLNQTVHDILEETYPDVWVEGEVSDPRTFPSGHTYFTLKDEGSQISAVLFRGNAAHLKFDLEHGLGVAVRGRVSTYIKRGQYQLIASRIEPQKAGALQLAFEQLKKKLAAEGIFDEDRKKPLPEFPTRIGIVTSRSGAALRDMLSVLGRRFAGLHVRVFPVLVQGDEASGQISRAIIAANEHFEDLEVLLVGRGGGSLEDLWAFNEESVARAISDSRIPIVSCVGHETDFTIADLAADLRAPTPSAAAELVVRERAAVVERLEDLASRLAPSLRALLRETEERLQGLLRSPFLRDPSRIFEQKAQRIDELAERLGPALKGSLRALEERFRTLPGRLAPAAARRIQDCERELARLSQGLDALSPLKVLGRGYAIAFKSDGRAVRSVREVKTSEHLKIRLSDGELATRVE